MTAVLDKKYTAKDSKKAIVSAILKLAQDQSARILYPDHIEWLEIKLKEIARLTKILKKKMP